MRGHPPPPPAGRGGGGERPGASWAGPRRLCAGQTCAPRSSAAPGPPRQCPARPATPSHRLQPSAPHLLLQAPQRPREADGSHLPGEAAPSPFRGHVGALGPATSGWGPGSSLSMAVLGSELAAPCPRHLGPWEVTSWSGQEPGLCSQTMRPWASYSAAVPWFPLCGTEGEQATQQPACVDPRSAALRLWPYAPSRPVERRVGTRRRPGPRPLAPFPLNCPRLRWLLHRGGRRGAGGAAGCPQSPSGAAGPDLEPQAPPACCDPGVSLLLSPHKGVVGGSGWAGACGGGDFGDSSDPVTSAPTGTVGTTPCPILRACQGPCGPHHHGAAPRYGPQEAG